MWGPPRPWEVDARTRRRRVRALLIQAALWAPSMNEKDAILEALQELLHRRSPRQSASQAQIQATSTRTTSCRRRSRSRGAPRQGRLLQPNQFKCSRHHRTPRTALWHRWASNQTVHLTISSRASF